MDPSARTFGTLRFFRDSFYRCLDRRADALFELPDAILTAGSVPSPPHLSLAAVHRRGWGSLYAALSMGRMDEGRVRDLLSGHALENGGPGDPPIYAVDVSVWPRCDGETSPERGYYYHPSRHSAGQPPSSLAGPISWWPSSASSVTPGWRPWTPGECDRHKTPTRGRRRADAVAGATATRTGSPTHLRLRCRLRSGEAPARVGRVPRADLGQAALQPGLLRSEERRVGKE